MKRIVLFSFICWGIFLYTAAQNIGCDEYERMKQEILEELDQIDRVISPRLSPRDRQFLQTRLDRIADKLQYLEDNVHPMSVYPMTDRDFTLLISSVRNEHMDSDKIRVIERAAYTNFFTTSQLIRMIEIFPFDSDRLKAIEIVYPNVLDKEQSFRLYEYLTFSSSKEKLDLIIRQFTP